MLYSDGVWWALGILLLISILSFAFSGKIPPSLRLPLLNLGNVAILIFVVLFAFILPPTDPLQLAAIVVLLIGGVLGLAYQGYLSIQMWRDKKRDEAQDIEDARDTEIPEHYTIGDDGQIVELKKPRKRSKNPHQR